MFFGRNPVRYKAIFFCGKGGVALLVLGMLVFCILIFLLVYFSADNTSKSFFEHFLDLCVSATVSFSLQSTRSYWCARFCFDTFMHVIGFVTVSDIRMQLVQLEAAEARSKCAARSGKCSRYFPARTSKK